MKTLSILIATLLTSTTVFAERVLVTKISQIESASTSAAENQKTISTSITFKAISGGCSSAESFTLKIKQKKDVQLVTIVRTVPDFCEAIVPDFTVTLNTTELNRLKNILILNPVLVDYN